MNGQLHEETVWSLCLTAVMVAATLGSLSLLLLISSLTLAGFFSV